MEKVSGGLEREFLVTQTRWIAFAREFGLKPVSITFSDERIQQAIQQAINGLNEQIVDIFNNLDGFSQSINSYLTSEEEGRNEFGSNALKYAKNLEPQTKEVIKSVSADEKE